MKHYNDDYTCGEPGRSPTGLNERGVRLPDVNRIRDEDGALIVWFFGRSRPPADRELIEVRWDHG